MVAVVVGVRVIVTILVIIGMSVASKEDKAPQKNMNIKQDKARLTMH